ncbi:aminoacyl-histidine dipeptidase [bacterium]|nr:aminoacyl-histidine dipeptidase [bacterium]
MSDHILSQLEPQRVFDYFFQITQIPRPSKKEEKIREYVIGIAKKLNRDYQEDAAGNIVIRKPATQGYETAPTVILQGHVDMVCEKTNEINFDFDNDPIQVRVDGEFIKATQTTLGADNGIAVAAMLAILEDEAVKHGPLELLFTMDEETGLTGATKLDPKMLKGRYLLNLDSEEEGLLYVGCAGAKDCIITVPVKWKESHHEDLLQLSIKVDGCVGGHSGLDIHLGRSNAIKLLTRILWNLHNEFGIRICDIRGGTRRNAIPRDADAVIMIPTDELNSVRKRIQSLQKAIKSEYKLTDPNIKISFKEMANQRSPMTKKSQTTGLLNLLYALPNGVFGMSQDIPGLVETSVNLATLETNKTSIVIGSSHRSSVESKKRDIVDRVFAIASLAEADVEETDGYPGWKPDMNSKVLRACREVFGEVYGKEPAITAIHAGLECGIIGEKFSGMEMISFGPTIKNAHSPDECLHIPSVKPFYESVSKILEKMTTM